MNSQTTDERNHPVYDHYGSGEYEPIKIINHYNMNFNLGNAIKYILRAGKKDDNPMVKDLKKAIDYIQYEIERISEPDEVFGVGGWSDAHLCGNCKHKDKYAVEPPCCECMRSSSVNEDDKWEELDE